MPWSYKNHWFHLRSISVGWFLFGENINVKYVKIQLFTLDSLQSVTTQKSPFPEHFLEIS